LARKKSIRPDRNKIFKEVEKALEEAKKLNADVMISVQGVIKANKYQYTKKVKIQVETLFNGLEKDITKTINTLEVKVGAITAASIKAIGGTTTAQAVAKRVLLDQLSPALHTTQKLIRKGMLAQVKSSIARGEGVVKAAKKLLAIDPTKAKIPGYIREIEAAARKAIMNPEDIAIFKRALRKHQRYINKLTREGAAGFEHLGIRGFTRDFTKRMNRLVSDIGTATQANVDQVVNRWLGKKALYHQKVVLRTESSKAYHNHMRAYTGNDTAPTIPQHPNCLCYYLYIFDDNGNIIGLEYRTSGSHVTGSDECDALEGLYYNEAA
jgi:hypothetical protein